MVLHRNFNLLESGDTWIIVLKDICPFKSSLMWIMKVKYYYINSTSQSYLYRRQHLQIHF